VITERWCAAGLFNRKMTGDVVVHVVRESVLVRMCEAGTGGCPSRLELVSSGTQ